MKFHHIGYLTTNFKSSVKEFGLINYLKTSSGRLINDKLLKFKIQFIQNSNSIIEFKPYKNNYGLNKIAKRQNYAYHFDL